MNMETNLSTASFNLPHYLSKSGYSALIVDDYVTFRKLLALTLESLPQITDIDFAENGEHALNMAETKKYDLIFLDVMMPVMDGYETCSKFREMPEYKKTPIIMVSGNSSPFDEVKGVISGCTTYVTKPIQQEPFQKLSNRVLKWLEEQKSNNN